MRKARSGASVPFVSLIPALTGLLLLVSLALPSGVSAAAPQDMEAAVRSYLQANPLTDFCDELWNLVGSKETAEITSRNISLARALGLTWPKDQGSPRIDKTEIRKKLGHEWLQGLRRRLGAFLTSPDSGLTLTPAQRLFLEWHFLNYWDYKTNLIKLGQETTVVVGWNASQMVAGGESRSCYTFGLIGCTAILVQAQDGTLFFSHGEGRGLAGDYNTELQFWELDVFLKNFPIRQLYCIGHHARPMADLIAARHAGLPILVHPKASYLTTTYSIQAKIKGPDVLLSYEEKPISPDYIPSTQVKSYLFPERAYPHGRFSQILPGVTFPSQEMVFRVRP